MLGVQLQQQCRRKHLLLLCCSRASSAKQVRSMGGGPRTFPGGVSKWQWKRMLEKKKRERDKIWLAKERSLYERRRRAQITALMPLRPWEKIHPEAPALPRVDKDPKIQEMARRFQRDSGVDLWSKADGPETCKSLVEQDLDEGAPQQKRPQIRVYHPLELSLSQRVSDASNSQRAGQEARMRFRRPFSREEKDPPEAAEVFQHSRFMLASYLRKQGNMGLGFGVAEKSSKPPPVLSSSSTGPSSSSGERTDYSSWLNALANDRARLAERQQNRKPQNSIAQLPDDKKLAS